MQRKKDPSNMSASEYVDYFVEKAYLFGKTRRLVDRPWRALEVLKYAVELGLDPKNEKDVRIVTEAFSPTALQDVYKQNLKAIIQSLPRDEGTARLDNIPIACIPQLGRPNAATSLTPLGDQYIVVDAGLSCCLHLMTKALIHRFETKSSSDIPTQSIVLMLRFGW